jgi:hypothetical protein
MHVIGLVRRIVMRGTFVSFANNKTSYHLCRFSLVILERGTGKIKSLSKSTYELVKQQPFCPRQTILGKEVALERGRHEVESCGILDSISRNAIVLGIEWESVV